MEIRHFNQNDDPFEISNVYENSWKYAYKNILPKEYLDSIPRGQWANATKKAGMNSLVMLENDVIIGTASFCKSRWKPYRDYGEIVSIYFLPEYMGKGYGSLLLGQCIAELKQCGFDKVLLWVLEENDRARKFYEKNGFICSEIFMNGNIGGKDVREVLYVIHRAN